MRHFVTVIVKPTMDCNIQCRHCYHLPSERSKDVMGLETFENIVKKVKDGFEHSRYIWHGGEPLLVPMSFYKDAISIQKKYYGKMGTDNTIQTNGTLLNNRFIEFCKSNRINLGISYEGGYECGLRPGMDPKKLDSTIEYMVKKNHMFLVSSTIHGGNVDKIPNIYHKFRDMGSTVTFNPVINIGCAKKNPDLALDPDVYVEKMNALFDEWATDPKAKVPVLPFYQYIQTAMDGYANISDCPHSSCLMKWISVYPNGDVYPCGKACPQGYMLGNINEVGSIQELFDSQGMRNILIPSIDRRERCKDCDIFQYCGGGCTLDAYAEGNVDSPDGMSCRIYRGIFRHIKSFMDDIMDRRPDMSQYNGFIKDAVMGRLISPQNIETSTIQ